MEEAPLDWDESAFHASATRPKLTDGCDRTLYSSSIFGCILIPYWNQTIWSVVAGVAVFFLIRHNLRKLGRYDPLAVKVYLRNLAYFAFYSARTKYTARWRTLPKAWVRS